MELKGNEEVEYDGETHTAGNLFDALKEGYYGKFWFNGLICRYSALVKQF